jgi:hypothetical protein
MQLWSIMFRWPNRAHLRREIRQIHQLNEVLDRDRLARLGARTGTRRRQSRAQIIRGRPPLPEGPAATAQ